MTRLLAVVGLFATIVTAPPAAAQSEPSAPAEFVSLSDIDPTICSTRE
ncbi:hypothetical protein ABGB19_25945 [Mycobacterium sp. B14F4]